jgi:hypothetical protein
MRIELSTEQIAAVRADLDSGMSVEQAAMAQMLRDYQVAVERVVSDDAAREHAGQLWREYAYYTVLGPKPEPVKIRDENGVELYQQSDRQQYKVLCRDLPQFAKEYKLNLKELEAVATGTQYEHKGWISGGYSGHHFDMSRAAPPPNPRRMADEAEDVAQYKAARETKVKRMSGYTPSPEPITYTPAK